MMDALELIRTRRSVKRFKSDMIPKDILEKIIDAGTHAPSAMNRQSPIIVAVTNKEIRDRLSRLNAGIMGTQSDPFYGAPVVLIVLADKNSANRVYDGSLVMANLMLAAHGLGIGSCWIHRAKEEFEMAEGKELLRSLGIEGEYEGIGTLRAWICRTESIRKSLSEKSTGYTMQNKFCVRCTGKKSPGNP